jgi:hypothetical protein
MSGVFPLTNADSFTLRSVSPARVSVSHSQKRVARSTLSHRWHIKVGFSNRSAAEYRQIEGFMDAQHGQAETFTIVLPPDPLGTWLGAPVVNGAAQTGYTLNLRGFTANQTGVIKSGDIFKSANVAKVYRAAADANSDAGGLVAVTLNCQIVASPADGEAITYSDVPFTVANTSDNVETAYAAAMIGSMGLDLIEVP